MNQIQLSKLTTDAQKLELFGTTIQVETQFDEKIVGQLFFTDDKCIILKNDQEYYYINQDFITNIDTIQTQPFDFGKLIEDLSKDSNLLNNIKDSTQANIQQAIAKVMPRQQILYEHLTKMYKDTQWEQQSILIPSLKIKITEPYDANSCTSTDQGKKALERVKKMITKLWDNRQE